MDQNLSSGPTQTRPCGPPLISTLACACSKPMAGGPMASVPFSLRAPLNLATVAWGQNVNRTVLCTPRRCVDLPRQNHLLVVTALTQSSWPTPRKSARPLRPLCGACRSQYLVAMHPVFPLSYSSRCTMNCVGPYVAEEGERCRHGSTPSPSFGVCD